MPSPSKIKLGGKSVPPEFLEDRQPDDSQTDRWVTGKERGRPESLLLLFLFFKESTEKMPLVAELRLEALQMLQIFPQDGAR